MAEVVADAINCDAVLTAAELKAYAIEERLMVLADGAVRFRLKNQLDLMAAMIGHVAQGNVVAERALEVRLS